MFKLKEDEVYFVVSEDPSAVLSLRGLIYRDTMCLDVYEWRGEKLQRLYRKADRASLRELYAVLAEDRSQRLSIERYLSVDACGFTDTLTLVNPTLAPEPVDMNLAVRPRLIDLFSLRDAVERALDVETKTDGSGRTTFARTGEDGVTYSVTVEAPDLDQDLRLQKALAPKQTMVVTVRVNVNSSDHKPDQYPQLPSHDEWAEQFNSLTARFQDRPGVSQAVEDLRTLAIRTAFGAYPAAGMPIFVNFFGRDALITGMMIVDWQPSILRNVLAFLAAHQGQARDPFREEEPGKILHEIRRGELSRTGKIPFGRYYGSVDSTPLFLMAAGTYLRATGDVDFIASIRSNIDLATHWLLEKLGDPSGLATFKASGSGLTVQSWKDSANSMVDELGKPARQPIAVAEVQGYCYAALMEMAAIVAGSDPDQSERLTARAALLRRVVRDKFWIPKLGVFAMALDADGRPLRVLSSDPGHLLWTGIVDDDIAGPLVETMLGKDLWSGWGLRTLGAGEAAYNPVSYHSGSVWPHDTGIFALGLARYGFQEQLIEVATALLDLADASPHCQMPELISGYGRNEFEGPVPYTHANSPQAWSAATVIRMAAFIADRQSRPDWP